MPTLSTAHVDAARYVHAHFRMRDASLLPFDDLPFREAMDLIRKVEAGEFRAGFGDLVHGHAGVSVGPAPVPEAVVKAGRRIKQRWGLALVFADRGGAMKLHVSGVIDLDEARQHLRGYGVEVVRDAT